MSSGKHAGRKDQRANRFGGRYHSTTMQAITNPLDPTTMVLVPRKVKKLTANEIYQAKRREYQTAEAKEARLKEKTARSFEKTVRTPEQKAEEFYATTGGRPGSVDI
jgi:hypothetical protein